MIKKPDSGVVQSREHKWEDRIFLHEQVCVGFTAINLRDSFCHDYT